MTHKELLKNGLKQLHIEYNDDIIHNILTFSDILLEQNKVMNLTAIKEREEVITHHILDSATLLTQVNFAGKRVADVGCGAGFPGMALKMLCPEMDLVLLDSLHKRIDFLEEAIDTLALEKVVAVPARAEEFAAKEREAFDVVVSRAVASLPILCELCLPLVRVGGEFIAMKSVNSDEEIQASQTAIQILGGEIKSQIDIAIPYTEITHRLLIISKKTQTPFMYPRRFSKISKKTL